MISLKVEGNTVYTVATEKLDDADYRQMLPVLERVIGQYKSLRWYFEMNDFEGWTLSAMWKDLKFDTAHADDFQRIAMVGEKKWHKWMTQLMKPFTTAEIRYFDLAERELAKAWIVG